MPELFFFLLGFSYLINPINSVDFDCPKIDHDHVFEDGIPYCPESVKDNAFTVTRCAFDQAKSWHKSTWQEKKRMHALVQALKDSNASSIIRISDNLKLNVCRSVKNYDSFLLMYTKPGVRDYSGPFIMFREGGETSNIVLQSPHDGQEGTDISTRDAFQASNALALVSNGHRRTLSGRIGGEENAPFASDWSHTKSDLAYDTFMAFRYRFNNSIFIDIHGLAANKIMVTDSVGWSDSHKLRSAFIKAAVKALGDRNVPIEPWHFNGWVTGIAMTQDDKGDGRRANNRWVATEFSVKLHQNTHVLSDIIKNIEKDYLKADRHDLKTIEEEREGDDYEN